MRVHLCAAVLIIASAFVVAGCKSSPESDASEPEASSATSTSTPSVAGADEDAIDWQAPVTVAVGDAYAGPWRMNDSKFHYVDDPSVALGPDGASSVVWVDNRAQNVLFQRFDAQGRAMLEEPANVSRSPEIFSWLPSVVVDPDDASQIYVLWQEIVFSGGSHGGEAFFARSVDGGQSFEAPLNLSTSKAGDGKGRLTKERWDNGSLDLALAPDGDLFAAWTEYEGRLWLRRSTDGGRSFEPAVHVAGSEQSPARGPSLVVTEDAVHLAWAVGQSDSADVRYARSGDDGASFSEVLVVAETDGHSDAPSIAVDQRGVVHAAFGESPTGMFGRYHVRYTRLAADAEAFAEPRALTAPDSASSSNFPTLATAGSATVYALWEHYTDGARRPTALGFARSENGGEAFGDPVLVPGTETDELGFNGSLQGMLSEKLSVNDAGDVAVVNSRFDTGNSSRVRLIRATSSASK